MRIQACPVSACQGPRGQSGALSVLAVTSELPWPLDTGGHLRTFHLLHALAQRFSVRLVVPVRPDQREAVKALDHRGLETVPVETGPRRRLREAGRALKSLLNNEPYVLYRRHGHAKVRSALLSEAARQPPDVLYLDHLDSWLYRNALPEVPSVLDLHNIYSTLTRRAAEVRSDFCSRLYLKHEAALLDRAERQAASGADLLLSVSDPERRHFAALGAPDVRLVPNGVDCGAYEDLPVGRRSVAPTIVFVGALSWGPNVAAARFLAEDVLPAVRTSVPQARLRIVGRDPSPETLALGKRPGVEVHGSVPDIKPYLRDASLLAVPLEAGGGTRLKILEAFAAGLPVVSTPVGAEGIDARDGEHLRIAPRSLFAGAVSAVLLDPDLATALAARARRLALETYDWSSVGLAASRAVGALALSFGKDDQP